MCNIIYNLDQNKYSQSCSNNYCTVENQKYGFDNMTDISVKRKLFGLFADYFVMLAAKHYCKHHDPHVIG